jgi:hypothetical protein
MKKDITRDYASDAFCFAADLNYPTYEQLYKRIYDDAVKSQIFRNPKDSIAYAENQIAVNTPALCDIMAVNKVFETLEIGGREYIIKAIKGVYYYPIHKGDISMRVHKLSLSIPASEATVYRYLKQARQLFSALRGLRQR